MNRKVYVRVAACSLFLAGCTGGSDAPTKDSVPASYEDLFDESFALGAEMEARLLARSNTAFPDMPSSGDATFEGYALLRMATAPAQTVLNGKSQVVVNFGTGDVSGKLYKFVGSDATGTFDAYSGKIKVTGGSIGAIVPNDLSMTYDGTLNGNGDELKMIGMAEGKFKASPIRGFIVDDPARVMSVNGTNVVGSLYVIGEKER